jgi:hypothetical protein
LPLTVPCDEDHCTLSPALNALLMLDSWKKRRSPFEHGSRARCAPSA